jgi:hypothetical protein
MWERNRVIIQVYMSLVVNNEGKRPLGRPRRKWEDNIKMDLKTYNGTQSTESL